jgi:hypothetical protein
LEPVAFLSYAHLDDAGTTGEVSAFHDRLQSELRIHTGLPVHIFFDKKSIGWGKRWADFIDHTIENICFLIPILTPAFFQSHACRGEYLKFADAEKVIGRRDLILPIYYVRCREMALRQNADPLVNDIQSRQYRDWRELRHKTMNSTEVLQQFAALASVMADTFFEINEAASLSVEARSTRIAQNQETLVYQEELLDKEVTYENVVAYTIETFPGMPVSREWTRELLNDIPKHRYIKIRDIDRVVKYAKSKVDQYARERPDLFQYGTDFITKSLTFVDAEFRRVHNVSPATMEAAIAAGLMLYS